jgi:hypothetical protein
MKRDGLQSLQLITYSTLMKTLICIALILFCGSVTYANDQKPSKDMQKILDERLSGPSRLSTDGLKKLHHEDLEEISKLTIFEKYRVPHPIGNDIIEYEIWRSIQTGGYLILKTGGEGGLLEVYGVGVPQKKTSTSNM